MRTFHLQRDEDETGISGTGRVAEGIQFSDGKVAIRWIVGEHRSTVTWDGIDAVEAIHGHGGRTRLVWHVQPESENYPAGHGWTPSTGPFAGPDPSCRVMLARYPCNWSREEHDPDLPPVDLDVFGYRRGRFAAPDPSLAGGGSE